MLGTAAAVATFAAGVADATRGLGLGPGVSDAEVGGVDAPGTGAADAGATAAGGVDARGAGAADAGTVAGVLAGAMAVALICGDVGRQRATRFETCGRPGCVARATLVMIKPEANSTTVAVIAVTWIP